jgi:hypothetical protein
MRGKDIKLHWRSGCLLSLSLNQQIAKTVHHSREVHLIPSRCFGDGNGDPNRCPERRIATPADVFGLVDPTAMRRRCTCMVNVDPWVMHVGYGDDKKSILGEGFER